MAMAPEVFAQLMQGVGLTIGQELRIGRGLREDTVDTKLLTRPRSFIGKPDEWPLWSMRFEALAGRVGFLAGLEECVKCDPATLAVADMREDRARESRLIYDVFVDLLEGRAAVLLRTCARGNGHAVWCKLKREFEG